MTGVEICVEIPMGSYISEGIISAEIDWIEWEEAETNVRRLENERKAQLWAKVFIRQNAR